MFVHSTFSKYLYLKMMAIINSHKTAAGKTWNAKTRLNALSRVKKVSHNLHTFTYKLHDPAFEYFILLQLLSQL